MAVISARTLAAGVERTRRSSAMTSLSGPFGCGVSRSGRYPGTASARSSGMSSRRSTACVRSIQARRDVGTVSGRMASSSRENTSDSGEIANRVRARPRTPSRMRNTHTV
jgi:hypothetical protein